MTDSNPAPGVALTSDLSREDAIPYFLWDQPMTVAELRGRLERSPASERYRLLGMILREAREPDVWKFTTPQEVARAWSDIEPNLGRRRAFWQFLLASWREAGLIR